MKVLVPIYTCKDARGWPWNKLYGNKSLQKWRHYVSSNDFRHPNQYRCNVTCILSVIHVIGTSKSLGPRLPRLVLQDISIPLCQIVQQCIYGNIMKYQISPVRNLFGAKSPPFFLGDLNDSAANFVRPELFGSASLQESSTKFLQEPRLLKFVAM